MVNSDLIRICNLMVVLLFSYGSICHAQTEAGDSISPTTTLETIEVTAPEQLRTADRMIFYPAEKLKTTMPNTIQLLAGVQIPDLIVDPANGNISVFGGGTLAIRINGRPTTNTDLLAIAAKDVIKIEYISNPGGQYGKADRVLEFTVKRRNQGYGGMFNLLQSPNRGWGDYTASVKYVAGRSEWSADYHSNPMWDMDCYRNNHERFVLPIIGNVSRTEKGVKTPNRMVTHRGALQYSYAKGSAFLFNVQARIIRQNDRYASLGIITTRLNNESTECREQEVAPFTSWQGSIDIYLHWKINRKHKLYFNVVPGFVKSQSERRYSSGDLNLSTSISGKGFGGLSELVWEGRIGKGLLTTGIRLDLQSNRSLYHHANHIVRNIGLEGHLFVDWRQTVREFTYAVGMDGQVYWLTQPVSKDFRNLTPGISLSYRPANWWEINIAAKGTVVIPTINQLNPVTQQIDIYQYSIGSLSLTTFRQYKSELNLDFKVLKNTSLRLTAANTHARRPIMSAKTYEDNAIIRSFYNSGFHDDYILKTQIRTPLPVKSLTLSLEAGWHKTINKGLNYRHSYSQAFVNAQIMYISGPWWIMVKYNTAYNELWGEMISSTNNNLLNLGAGYRYKGATFMAGIVNPIGNVRLKSRDLSSIAGYDRTYYVASTNCLAWIGLTLNIYKGSHRSSSIRKLDNSKTYETIKNINK